MRDAVLVVRKLSSCLFLLKIYKLVHSYLAVAGLSPSFQGHFLFAGQKDFIFHGNLTVKFRFIDFRCCVGVQAIHCKSSWTDAVTLELSLLFAVKAGHIFFITLLLLQRCTCSNQELTNGCKWSFWSGQKLFFISSSVHLTNIMVAVLTVGNVIQWKKCCYSFYSQADHLCVT